MTVLTTELIVSDKVEFHGIAQENIIVKDSGVLILRGIACKDVIIDAASSAHIYGIVSGNLIVNGGTAKIYGIINGHLLNNGGNVLISPDAVVKK